MINRRTLLALAATVDIALHARGRPVAAKALAARHGLAPRHLETLLQDLVRGAILKGTRGPQGGYELARERRRISVADVVRAIGTSGEGLTLESMATEGSALLRDIVAPVMADAAEVLLARLDGISVEDLCRAAEAKTIIGAPAAVGEFHI